MNIIKDVLDRVESFRKTNKKPCRSYATRAAAEKATEKMAKRAGRHFGTSGKGTVCYVGKSSKGYKSARYIVIYNDAWGRWIGAIDMTELIKRPESGSGYLGICSRYGFYSY